MSDYYWKYETQDGALDFIGKTIVSLEGLEKQNDELKFTTSEGENYVMYHEQDCCEHVYLADIDGDLDDVLGSTIIDYSVNTESGGDYDNCESYTWTFYSIKTTKGSLWLRWNGESNGYYSESVSFLKLLGEK